MSPHRALTIAINHTIAADRAAGVPWPIGGRKIDEALAAASLATRILDNMPEGWVILDRSEVDGLDRKMAELEGSTHLLLAFQIERDGHAPNLGIALKIAEDRERVHELYPEIPA